MAAATVFGAIGGNGSSVSWMQFKKKEKKVNKVNMSRISCSFSNAVDPYKTLRIQPGASESDVKKAFRRLALKYHPDVCRGNDCGVQFHQINEAYDIVMANLRGESNVTETYVTYGDAYEAETYVAYATPYATYGATYGDAYEVYDDDDDDANESCDNANESFTYTGKHPDWEDWEEWMGWEGAAIHDYSAHINPYI